ncbi:MAG: cadherin-like domain-containing protein [Pseudomonadota bacterium]
MTIVSGGRIEGQKIILDPVPTGGDARVVFSADLDRDDVFETFEITITVPENDVAKLAQLRSIDDASDAGRAAGSVPTAVAHADDHTGLTGDHQEHMAALDLVDPADATHVAVQSGDWFDPDTWENGEIPGDDARVLIPDGIDVLYAGESDARIFTLGVDGQLRFDPETDSKLVVDTLVVMPGGRMEIGTVDTPVGPDTNIDIVIANNNAIDTTWDPQLLSRGVISLGDVEIHGSEIDSHLKVIADPMAGDSVITLVEPPAGWQVGDTIVIAGTHNPGHSNNFYNREYRGDTNEVRVITAIDGNQVTLDQPLEHDHDSPRADLKTSVANYSRSITFSSEDGPGSLVHERGHVMFMGSDDVDVRFAAFEHLGRTDKSERSFSALSLDEVHFDSNVQGRYSLHLHRLGIEDRDNPIIIEGNAVVGSPGWGIAQHGSHANLHNNATLDIWGASYVSETGDETGTWSDNISLGNVGTLEIERNHDNVAANDFGRTGNGFWLQSRLIDTYDNIAVAARTGFVWIAQGSTEKVDASFLDQPESIGFGEPENAKKHAISLAVNNEVFGSERALTVTKGTPNQEHDIRSVIDGFLAWEVRDGIKAIYTAHYTYKNIDLTAVTDNDPKGPAGDAFTFRNNASDMVLIDPKITGFEHAYDFTGFFSPALNATQADKQFVVIGGQLSGIKESVFAQDDWAERTILVDPADIEIRTPTVDVTIPAIETNDENFQELQGTRFDSLGLGPISLGTDRVGYERNDIRAIVRSDGYWEKDGRLGVIWEGLFQDRVTGEIVKIGFFVPFVDNDVVGRSYYHGGTFHGELPDDNTAPDSRADSFETDFRTPATFDLIADATDPDGDPLRVDGFVQPRYGRVKDNEDGTVTYTPDLGFEGTDTFEYWVTDGFGNYTKSYVSMMVHPRAPATSDEGVVLEGDAAANTLEGTIHDDQISGLGANDVLRGLDGDDSLFGGVGNDLLTGGVGADRLDGGEGTDRAQYSDATAGVRADLGDAATNAGDAAGDSYVSIENLLGSRHDDVLLGDAGRNQLSGHNGDDTLFGGAGDDMLIGGAGADLLDGGAGNDTASYKHATAALRADLQGAGAGAAAGDVFEAVENLIGSRFSDTLRGDLLANDLQGGDGNDKLYGRGGSDTLSGGDGQDVLYGNGAQDILEGGAGADRFAFYLASETRNGAHNRDVILDFDSLSSSADIIDLSRIQTTRSDGAFVFEGLVSSFSGEAGELRYARSAAKDLTLIQGDIDGDGKADLQIELSDLHFLHEDHFVL